MAVVGCLRRLGSSESPPQSSRSGKTKEGLTQGEGYRHKQGSIGSLWVSLGTEK